ncbi:MAG: ABC transporter substrate-binding protein [Armatimonadota bacterium]
MAELLPRRIVSLTPGITEILYAIGCEPQIAAVTVNCDYPAIAKRKPKVGDMRASVERIISFRPDMIVADTLFNASQIRRLKALKQPLVEISCTSFGSVGREIARLGRLTGHAIQADAIAAKFVQAEHHPKPGKRRSLFILSPNPLPLWVAGHDTYANEMLKLAGYINTSEKGGRNYYQLSTESVMKLNPDVIFVVGSSSDVQLLRKHPVFKQMTAVKRGAVYTVEPNLYVRNSPRLLQGLEFLKHH